MTKYEQIVFDALEFTGLPAIPEEMKEGDSRIWMTAIAKTLTYSGTYSLAVVRNQPGRSPMVLKSFSASGIARIESIHPYEFVKESLPEGFKSKDELIKFISNKYNTPVTRVEVLTDDELKSLYENYLVKQSENEAEQKKKTTTRTRRKQ